MTNLNPRLVLDTFRRFFLDRNLSLAQQSYLVATSGGLDSAVLCALCQQAGMHFAIAHANFGLRGDESLRDEAFVQRLGEVYNVPVFVQRFDTAAHATAQRLSVQVAARDLRYNWFETLRQTEGFAYTLLAHHADDNIETLLLNFFRGTGLEGLTGMPAVNTDTHCLRPLLSFRRSELEAFARSNNLSWVHDSSNDSNHYTRNFLRNAVLPQLRTAFPAVDQNLLNNLQRFAQAAALYREAVAERKQKLCIRKGAEVHLQVALVQKHQHTPVLYEIIKEFGFGEGAVGEVLKLAMAESGRYIANDQYRIIRHRRWLVVAPLSAAAQTVVVEKEDETVLFGGQQMQLKRLPAEGLVIDPSAAIAYLDASAVDFPLVLRKWKPGDYFYPLGLRKKKKLARFFIDQKLSKTEKEAVWVLESHKRVLWVVGLRIDDRFKIAPSTREVLQLSLSNL